MGGIPFYRRGSTSSYPSESDRGNIIPGMQGSMEDGFGEACTHVDLPFDCVSDSDCHALYRCHPVGKICVKRNVPGCDEAGREPCWCYVHQDCDENKMCAGTGRCVKPVIEIWNEMEDIDAEFRIYSSQCNESEGMKYVNSYGTSHWGRVPDILQIHGLCSQRKWYEYNETMSRSRMCAPGHAYCDLDVNEVSDGWVYTRQEENSDQPGFFGQGVGHQDAHVCDRDYMHIRGMGSCFGESVWWMGINGTHGGAIQKVGENSLGNGKVVQTYRPPSPTSIIRLGAMRHVSDQLFGFLGKRPGYVNQYTQYPDWQFKKCSSIRQCYRQEFTVYGHPVRERRIRVDPDGSDQEYSLIDTFQCGGYGHSTPGDPTRCSLDLSTATMYRVLCYSAFHRQRILQSCIKTIHLAFSEKDFIQDFCQPFRTIGTVSCGNKQTRFIDHSDNADWPDNYIPQWAAGEEEIRLGMPCLINRFQTDLFKPVKPFSDITRPTSIDYLGAMTCVNTIYESILEMDQVVPSYVIPRTTATGTTTETHTVKGGRSMYHFSQYGVYEYPFSWLVKCSVLVGRYPSDGSVLCPGWEGTFLPETSNIWDYLTSADKGFMQPDFGGLEDEWDGLVNQVVQSGVLESYFDFSTQGTDRTIRRNCTSQRGLIRKHIDDSPKLRELIKKALNDPNTDFWPELDGESIYDEGANIICHGVTGCLSNTEYVCGCTYAMKTSIHTDEPDPIELVRNWLTVSQREKVVLNDFFQLGNSLLIEGETISIPLFRYNLIRMENGKIRHYAQTEILLSTDYPEYLDRVKCTRVNVSLDEFVEERSCLTEDPTEDDRLSDAEEKFGLEKLQQSRTTKSFMVLMMGTGETADVDWMDGKGIAGQLIRDTVPDRPRQDPFQYFSVNDIKTSGYLAGPSGDQSDDGWTVSNMGALYILLASASPKHRGYQSSNYPRSFVDSYCGLHSTGSTYRIRRDGCGAGITSKLKDCDPTSEARPYIRADLENGQTCIHSMSCLTFDTIIRKDDRVFPANEILWPNVPAPGWNLRKHHNAHHRWNSESSYDPPLENELPILDLWRHHANPSHVSVFYLPIGVFLETYTFRDLDTDRLNDPIYSDGTPYGDQGMWPMCPHDASTFNTNIVDAGKSKMMDLTITTAGTRLGWKSYQYYVNATPTSQCSGSDTSVTKCVVRGFMSYRVGFRPGFTANSRECTLTQFPMPVQINTFKCVECSWWHPTYCRGLHDCMFTITGNLKRTTWTDATYINPFDIETIVNGDKSVFHTTESSTTGQVNRMRKGLSNALTERAIFLALYNEVIKHNKGTNMVHKELHPIPAYETDKALWNVFPRYNAGINRQFEDTLPPLVSGSRCQSATNSSFVRYDECNFDDNYDAFIQSVNTNMKIPEGLVVPPGVRAAYFTDKQHMMSVGIPSCRYASRQESICSVDIANSTYHVMNPWLGGGFNVFVKNQDGTVGGCDTDLLSKANTRQESSIVIDTLCTSSTSACSEENLPRFDRRQSPICSALEGNTPPHNTVPITSKHNMCTQQPAQNPARCTHDQGMLYGMQGLPVTDLYVPKDPSVMGSLPGGIFSNPIFMGQVSTGTKYGRVYSNPDEIAGHHIVYSVTRQKTLQVKHVPLQHYHPPSADKVVEEMVFDASNLIDPDTGQPTLVPWLTSNLGVSVEEDQPLLMHMRFNVLNQHNEHWTCPLRLLRLWSGQDKTFVPYVPNPLRSGKLYGQIMHPYVREMNVHPTTKAIPIDVATRLHTGYWTTNGFCVYKGGESGNNEQCALYALAKSVLTEEYNNYTTVFSSACTDQIDWPYHPIHGRDNSFTSASTSSNCAVLDRLPHFQYRIRNNAQFKPSGTKTTDQPGTCHMGRPSLRPPVEGCWRVGETTDLVHMRCPNNVTLDIPKQQIKTPMQMVQDGMSKRQICKSHCSVPPKFKVRSANNQTGYQTGYQDMPVPEVGYGRPFRWEMARMIAGDLRILLCGKEKDCTHLMNASQWTLTNFLHNYFQSPEKLVLQHDPISRTVSKTLLETLDDRDSNPPSSVQEMFEKEMWESNPWVACSKSAGCTGTMTKKEWLDDRGTMCTNKVIEHLAANPDELAVEMDLCNLNSQMDQLCRLILESLLAVKSINCISSGGDVCLPKRYFYTPSTFSTSNQQVCPCFFCLHLFMTQFTDKLSSS